MRVIRQDSSLAGVKAEIRLIRLLISGMVQTSRFYRRISDSVAEKGNG